MTRLSRPDLLTRCARSRRSGRTVRPAALACFRFRKWHRFAGQEGRGSPPLDPSPPSPPASMPPGAWHHARKRLRLGWPLRCAGPPPGASLRAFLMPRLHTASAFFHPLTATVSPVSCSRVQNAVLSVLNRGLGSYPLGGSVAEAPEENLMGFAGCCRRVGGGSFYRAEGTNPGRGSQLGGFGGSYPTETSGGASAGPEVYSPRSGSTK